MCLAWMKLSLIAKMEKELDRKATWKKKLVSPLGPLEKTVHEERGSSLSRTALSNHLPKQQFVIKTKEEMGGEGRSTAGGKTLTGERSCTCLYRIFSEVSMVHGGWGWLNTITEALAPESSLKRTLSTSTSARAGEWYTWLLNSIITVVWFLMSSKEAATRSF